MAKILIVDDHLPFRSVFSETVSALDHEVFEAGSGTEALALLQDVTPDLMFLDLRMPDMDGMEVLREVRKSAFASIPVVIVTGYADSTNTIEAIKLGAFDHLTKPISRKDLTDVLQRALGQPDLQSGREKVSASVSPVTDESLVGVSRAFREVEKLIGFALSARSPVLLLGETGTGKREIAQVINKHTGIDPRPLKIIRCSNPESFFEEFQGQLRASQIEYECIYLEELLDCSLPNQATLISLLQAAQKNGSPRVISSSCGDLTAAVREKTFREDLYYHLSVFPITVPPLRERGLDILVLAETFLGRLAPDSSKVLTSSAAKTLLEYSWPGNVRELQNVMQRAQIVARGRVVDVQDLGLKAGKTEASVLEGDLLDLDFYTATARLEKMLLEKALGETRGNRTEAAKKLGINRQLLYSKLKEHGIE